MKEIRTSVWWVCGVMLVGCVALLFLMQNSRTTPTTQTVQQPAAQESKTIKKVARTAPPVAESNELRFRITGVTMAAQRPLPQAPQRPLEPEGSNQSPSVTQ
mgnify:CR=1 FL=1